MMLSLIYCLIWDGRTIEKQKQQRLEAEGHEVIKPQDQANKSHRS